MAAESYPDDLTYHPRARLGPHRRRRGRRSGITWYAPGRARRARPLRAAGRRRDDLEGRRVRRGRVGQGRLRPDRAALGRGARGEPEGRRRARDGERGPLRRGLARPHPPRRPGGGRRADGRRGVQGLDLLDAVSLPLADRRRPRGDARGDRRLVGRGALPRHPRRRCASGPRSTSSPRSPSRSSSRTSRSSPSRNVAHRRGALVPRRRDLRPLRAGGRRRRPPARRVPDRVHAVPAGDEPGRAADDLRVPDRDLRADRHGRLERVRLRRHDGRRRRLLHRQARDRPVEGRPRRGASTRRCARS